MEWLNQILFFLFAAAIIAAYLILNKSSKVSSSRFRIAKCNCAKVYVGSYVGGGTNEFERVITCGYKVISGKISRKKLRPVRVQETTSDGHTVKLKTFVIYPITDIAEIDVFGSGGNTRVILYKLPKRGGRSRIYKQRL